MTSSLTTIDLFSGAGGMAEGFRQEGFETLVASDYDEMAAKTFTFNHPQVPFLISDIQELNEKLLLDTAGAVKGSVDVVCGGPPCQGFSLAGPRVADDPRNRLFLDFVRIVRYVEPKLFVFENVTGLLSMQEGMVLKAIIKEFSDLGYKTTWKVLNAADYGVPQARPRFILVGYQPHLNFLLPQQTHFSNKINEFTLFSTKDNQHISVWDAISDLPSIEQGEGSEELKHSGLYNNKYQLSRKGVRTPGLIFNHRATCHNGKVLKRYAAIPEGGGIRDIPEELRTKKNNVHKLSRNKPSRTVTCNHRTDLLHPVIPRGTTVREAARLQSFDDDYRFFGNLTRKAAWVTQDDQVGNAVPPLLAKSIASSISTALDYQKGHKKNVTK